MKSKQKLQVGLILSIIGLGFFLFHMIQYIDLIERINALAYLLGEEGIDTAGITLEVFLGFLATFLGIIFLGSLYKKETEERKIFITQEPKDIRAQAPHYCQNCGEKIIPNTKFCVKCGDNLTN